MKKLKSQKLKKNETTNPTYQGLSINTGDYVELPVYTNMLKPMLGQINALLSHHSRVQLLRFDLHFPVTQFMDASSGNLVVSNFFKQIKQDLASRKWNHHKNVIHFWTREVGGSFKGHYHCMLGVSSEVRLGTFYTAPASHAWGLIYNRWNELSGGVVRPSKKDHYVINRNNHEELDKAFKHFSYMCKSKTKDFGTGEHHKRFSSSRLKPKKMADQHSALGTDYSDKAVVFSVHSGRPSHSASDSKRVSTQLMAIGVDAVIGADISYKQPTHRENKTKEVPDQKVATYCHAISLEQFFAPKVATLLEGGRGALGDD